MELIALTRTHTELSTTDIRMAVISKIDDDIKRVADSELLNSKI